MIEVVSFPVIVVLCYFAGMVCKSFKNEKLDSFIPVICGFVGIALALAIYFTIPNFMPADNWAVAVAIGVESGLAAVGMNQIIKQTQKLKGI